MKALKLFYKLIHKINDLWLSVIHKRPCGNIKKQNVFLASFFIRSTRIMHTVHAFSYPYDSSSERHFHSSFARAFTFSREIIRLLVENLINFCLFIQSSNICRFTDLLRWIFLKRQFRIGSSNIQTFNLIRNNIYFWNWTYFGSVKVPAGRTNKYRRCRKYQFRILDKYNRIVF